MDTRADLGAARGPAALPGRPAAVSWFRLVLVIGIIVVVAQLASELLAPHLLNFPHRDNPTGLSGTAGAAADDAMAPVLSLAVPTGWLIAASWWACGAASRSVARIITAVAAGEVIFGAALAARGSGSARRRSATTSRPSWPSSSSPTVQRRSSGPGTPGWAAAPAKPDGSFADRDLLPFKSGNESVQHV